MFRVVIAAFLLAGRADAILIAAFGKGLSPPPKISDQEVGLIQEECPF